MHSHCQKGSSGVGHMAQMRNIADLSVNGTHFSMWILSFVRREWRSTLGLHMQTENAVAVESSNELIEAILAAFYEAHDNQCGEGVPYLCCIESR